MSLENFVFGVLPTLVAFLTIALTIRIFNRFASKWMSILSAAVIGTILLALAMLGSILVLDHSWSAALPASIIGGCFVLTLLQWVFASKGTHSSH